MFKKNITAAILVAILPIASFSQVKVGPEIGMNIGSIKREIQSFSVSNSVRMGLRAGAIADVKLMDNLYIQPGLFFSNRSTKSTADIFSIIEIEQTFSVNYIELPLQIQYKSGKPGEGRLFVGIGPYVGYALGGKIKTTVDDGGLLGLLGGSSGFQLDDFIDEEADATVGTDSTDAVRPFDVGANVNLGYELPMGLFFRGQVGMGFMNTAPLNDIVTQKNWAASITIGYLIGFKSKGRKEEQ